MLGHIKKHNKHQTIRRQHIPVLNILLLFFCTILLLKVIMDKSYFIKAKQSLSKAKMKGNLVISKYPINYNLTIFYCFNCSNAQCSMLNVLILHIIKEWRKKNIFGLTNDIH